MFSLSCVKQRHICCSCLVVAVVEILVAAGSDFALLGKLSNVNQKVTEMANHRRFHHKVQKETNAEKSIDSRFR